MLLLDELKRLQVEIKVKFPVAKLLMNDEKVIGVRLSFR